MLWLQSNKTCVYLCNSSAPLGRPTAYWYLLLVLAMMGVMCLAMAVATILLGIVPHAIGLILPFGLISGIFLADRVHGCCGDAVGCKVRERVG